MESRKRAFRTALLGGGIMLGLLGVVSTAFGIAWFWAQPHWLPLFLLVGGIWAGTVSARNWLDRTSGPVETPCEIIEVKKPSVAKRALFANVIVKLPDGQTLKLLYNSNVCTIAGRGGARSMEDRLRGLVGHKATILYGRYTRSLAHIQLR